MWKWLWACALVLLFMPACQALEPQEARHLLARTGFGGPSQQELAALLADSYPQAVERLLQQPAGNPPTAPALKWFKAGKGLSPAARKAQQKQRREQGLVLKSWWYQQMLTTQAPLQEHMILFWHNHFTSSLKKVRQPLLLSRQHQTLRRHALGNFQQMLRAISQDGAMLIYLDSQTSRKQQANENLAREWFELFTLGEGHYREQDIKAAARAFTGWRVNPQSGEVQFVARQHDSSPKTLFGQTGPWNSDDVVRITLQQPRVAEFIVEKLWQDLMSTSPEPAEVKRLAAEFRQDWEIKPLLRALLLSAAFRDPTQRGSLIKSPVELMVGSLRQLQQPLDNPRLLVRYGARLQQDLFDPPNVKGWVKGWPAVKDWITSDSLLKRRQFLQRLSQGLEPGQRRQTGPLTFAGLDALQPSQFAALLLPLPPLVSPPAGQDPLTLTRALLLDPVYQLK